MIEFVCTADAHLHPHRQCSHNAGVDRIDDGLNALTESLNVARHHGCPWVFLGDLKHIKGIWNQYALNKVKQLLHSDFRDVEKFLIHGNHDGTAGGSGLKPLEGKGCAVFDKPQVFDDVKFLDAAVWPHQPTTELLPAFLNDAQRKGVKFLFGHVFLRNSVVGPTDRPLTQQGITLEEMGIGSVFEWAFLGDVHKQQMVPGSREGGYAIYPGSPLQLNWGDASDEYSSFLYVNLEKDPKVEKISIKAPRFRAVDWSGLSVEEVRGEVDKGTHKTWEGDFVKLIVTPVVDSKIIENIMERSKARWYSVTLRKKEKTPEARSELHAGMKPQELLQGYINVRPPDPALIKSPVPIVLKVGSKLLEEPSE